MKEKLAFGFYSQLKGEDAPPYLGDGLIAVADGLGGSGSTVHALRPEERKAVRREIRRRLIPAEAREDRASTRFFIRCSTRSRTRPRSGRRAW